MVVSCTGGRRTIDGRHGTQTKRSTILQQTEKDVDATVQGLSTSVHSVPVQQHWHHLPGGRLHDSRCVHVYIHRGQPRLRQVDHRPGDRQSVRHRGPIMGSDVLQRVLRGRMADRGPGASPFVPEPHHRGRPQL